MYVIKTSVNNSMVQYLLIKDNFECWPISIYSFSNYFWMTVKEWLSKHQKLHTRDRNEAKKKIPPKPAKEQSKINFKSRLLSHCWNISQNCSLLLCFRKRTLQYPMQHLTKDNMKIWYLLYVTIERSVNSHLSYLIHRHIVDITFSHAKINGQHIIYSSWLDTVS